LEKGKAGFISQEKTGGTEELKGERDTLGAISKSKEVTRINRPFHKEEHSDYHTMPKIKQSGLMSTREKSRTGRTKGSRPKKGKVILSVSDIGGQRGKMRVPKLNWGNGKSKKWETC